MLKELCDIIQGRKPVTLRDLVLAVQKSKRSCVCEVINKTYPEQGEIIMRIGPSGYYYLMQMCSGVVINENTRVAIPSVDVTDHRDFKLLKVAVCLLDANEPSPQPACWYERPKPSIFNGFDYEEKRLLNSHLDYCGKSIVVDYEHALRMYNDIPEGKVPCEIYPVNGDAVTFYVSVSKATGKVKVGELIREAHRLTAKKVSGQEIINALEEQKRRKHKGHADD